MPSASKKDNKCGVCITPTIKMTHMLRTTAGSHERFLVIEVFGRYAGFTTMIPALAGAADRCLIPEHPFDMDKLTKLMMEDRDRNPSNYAVVLVSEGATMKEQKEMSFEGEEKDMFGHKKLGGIGDKVSAELKERSARFNNGRPVGIVNQRLSYMVRCGEPDAFDSIVPMAFGNIALDLINAGQSGQLVSLRKGLYDHGPLEIIMGNKKLVNVKKYYDKDKLRPRFGSFDKRPLFIMTTEIVND